MKLLLQRVSCEVVVLNQADPASRFHALSDLTLFILRGREDVFREFAGNSRLDYSVKCAHSRRNGMKKNN